LANRSEFRDPDLIEIMNKTSCLSLLCNAAVVWNTIRTQKIVDQLGNSGQSDWRRGSRSDLAAPARAHPAEWHLRFWALLRGG